MGPSRGRQQSGPHSPLCGTPLSPIAPNQTKNVFFALLLFCKACQETFPNRTEDCLWRASRGVDHFGHQPSARSSAPPYRVSSSSAPGARASEPAAGRLRTAGVAAGRASQARALRDESAKSSRAAMESRVSAECCGLGGPRASTMGTPARRSAAPQAHWLTTHLKAACNTKPSATPQALCSGASCDLMHAPFRRSPGTDGQEPERSADSQPQAARRENAVRQCPSCLPAGAALCLSCQNEGLLFAPLPLANLVDQPAEAIKELLQITARQVNVCHLFLRKMLFECLT